MLFFSLCGVCVATWFLQCFFVTLRGFKSSAFSMVVTSWVWIKTDGLVIGAVGFFMAFEGVESIAFASVGKSWVGVETDGLLIGAEGFLIALEAVESTAFAM